MITRSQKKQKKCRIRITLRRAHFNLGDDKNPYQTTSMEQSKQIFDQSAKPAFLDENIKADLRRSHFIFGNNEPNYITQTQRESLTNRN